MAPFRSPSGDTEELTRALMAAWADVYGGGMFCAPGAIPDDLPLNRLLTALEYATGTPRPPAEGEGAGLPPLPAEIPPETIRAFVSMVRTGEFVVLHTASYLSVFRRLGVTPEGVNHFLRAERAVIADIDRGARVTTPSLARIFESAIRLAVDPRRRVDPEIYTLDLRGDQPVVSRFKCPRVERSAFATPEELICQFTLPASAVVREVLAQKINYPRLADLTEGFFGRQVEAVDGTTTTGSSDRVVEFLLEGDRIRVWVRGEELLGIEGADCQAVLRYFCTGPSRRATGPEVNSATGCANAGRGARDLIEALTGVRATDWFGSRPYRWADGMEVRPRLEG